MWIKAIYCAKDTIYAKRLSAFLDKEYGSKIELNICTSIEDTINFIDQYKIDIALFDDGFEEEILRKLKDISCTCVLVTEQLYESNDNELNQIGKYQRGDRIYKDILELYSAGKKVKQINLNRSQTEKQKIYMFTSASGGVGTSTVAKAYAKKCAAYEKVLYLDLGLFSSIEIVEGNANGLDEILFALKSRRNILPIKLLSAVSSTVDRVFTYGPCSNEVDLLELNAEDARNLISGIRALPEYQRVIIDAGSYISLKEAEFMKSADMIVYIVDESDIGRKKYQRFCMFLEKLGNKEQMQMIKKMFVFRNKVKQDYNNDLWNNQSKIAGWAPYVAAGSYEAVIDRIAKSDSFSNMEIRNAE